MSESMITLLADLPQADPDPRRAERTRIRCHARLARLPRASTASAPSQRGRRAEFWQPLIAVLGVAYVAEAIVQALRVYGIR
ncbi:MAG: hypothetical protein ACRD3C_18025 [Vicinamibacterales bacterium]